MFQAAKSLRNLGILEYLFNKDKASINYRSRIKSIRLWCKSTSGSWIKFINGLLER